MEALIGGLEQGQHLLWPDGEATSHDERCLIPLYLHPVERNGGVQCLGADGYLAQLMCDTEQE